MGYSTRPCCTLGCRRTKQYLSYDELKTVGLEDLTNEVFGHDASWSVFVEGAVKRMLHPKYVQQYPDVHDRYRVVKSKFMDRYGFMRIPSWCEEVILREGKN